MAVEFSRELAFKFLKEILKFENPQSEFLNTSKLNLLKKIVATWYEYIPFQNIDQLCLTKREHRLPTVQEIINYHMKGRGGVCVYNAIFLYHVLLALDYDLYITAGLVFAEDDHAILVVSNVEEKGDSYLVEVGSGWPAFEPIPLHKLPTDLSKATVYRNSFIIYTYVREGDLVVRYHRKDYMENTNPIREDGWWKNGHTNLLKVDIEYLLSDKCNIWQTCVNVKVYGLTQMWAVVRYPGHKGVFVKSWVCSEDDGSGEKKVRDLKSVQEVVEAIGKNFPMLDKESVTEGVEFALENEKLYGTGQH